MLERQSISQQPVIDMDALQDANIQIVTKDGTVLPGNPELDYIDTKKEAFKTYLMFLLSCLIISVLLVVLVGIFIFLGTQDPTLPPINTNNELEVDELSPEITSKFGIPQPKLKMANDSTSPVNQQLITVNTMIDSYLDSHFSPIRKFLSGSTEAWPSIAHLQAGYFSLTNEQDHLKFKVNYQKQSDKALSIIIEHAYAPNVQSFSSKHDFNKFGLPVETTVAMNETNLSLKFDWDNSLTSAFLTVQFGDYKSSELELTDLDINTINIPAGLSSMDYDLMTDAYQEIVKSYAVEEASQYFDCDTDLLVNAWLCTKPEDYQTTEKCEPAVNIHAGFSIPDVNSMYFDEVGMKNRKCFRKGFQNDCNGASTFIPTPSHEISMQSLRQIKTLQGRTEAYYKDSINIIHNSICTIAPLYNKENWSASFCQRAFEIVSEKLNVPIGVFLLACRSSFDISSEKSLCPQDNFQKNLQIKTLREINLKYDKAVQSLLDKYSINVSAKTVFGNSYENSLIIGSEFQLNMSKKFNEMKQLHGIEDRRYIVYKKCIDSLETKSVVLGKSDREYLHNSCQKSELVGHEECEYGRYLTIIFYIPDHLHFVDVTNE